MPALGIGGIDMHGRIELLDKYYDITVTGCSPQYVVRVGDAEPQPASLDSMDSGDYMIRLGEQRVRAHVRVKGIVNPVEQAGLSVKGSGNKARSQMPGVVVDIHVAEGERIVKGQPMMTIESMKILTAITAPRHGKVGKIHFAPGQPFEKGAVLVTLYPEDES
jgi:biotin carboxyl carrier protein